MIPSPESSTSGPGASTSKNKKSENDIKMEDGVKTNAKLSLKNGIKKEIIDSEVKLDAEMEELPRSKTKYNQMNLFDSFLKMSQKKRKSEDSVESETTKKLKSDTEKSNNEDKPTLPKQKTKVNGVQPLRCSDCRQILDDPDLKLFPGDSDSAVEEYVALTDPKLSVFCDDDSDANDVCERLQHKITNFCVYDRNTHLCPFDSGLIEKNKELFFSGVIKPIYDEDPSVEGGVEARNMGPINEWWVSGFDGGENALVGFSTAFAEYILMNPSDLYLPFMDAVREKIHLSKCLIEFLCDNNDVTYEDLLNKLETIVPPQGISAYTEDSLLRHAQFLVDQIQSFDGAADESDPVVLIVTPCVRALINLAGVTLGKRRAMRRAERKQPADMKKDSFSLATTTPLVKSIFESFFTEQLANDESKSSSAPRRKRCGVCDACQLPDCGQCSFCRDMVKFGGSGRSKQACAQRRCPNMAVQEANEDDILDDNDGDEMDEKAMSSATSSIVHHAMKRKSKVEITWIGEPIKTSSFRTYYKQVSVNNETFEPGDCVMVTPNDPSIPMYIAKILYLWEDSDGKGPESGRFHAMWFCRGSDTVLGETSDSRELFGLYECEDSHLVSIHSKCTVVFKATPDNWAVIGGSEESLKTNMLDVEDEKTFFYQKWYDAHTARIEDPPILIDSKNIDDPLKCISCDKIEERSETETPEVGDVLEEKENCITFKSVRYLSRTFVAGDCIYLDPDIYDFTVLKSAEDKKLPPKKKDIDESIYTEAYRKSSDYVKGSNADVPQPFKIAFIKKIFKKSQKSEKTKLLVSLFYRPENTHQKTPLTYSKDLNLLYWSDEEFTVDVTDIKEKCYVRYHDDLTSSPDEFCQKGPHHFYFTEAYNSSSKEFELPPRAASILAEKDSNKLKGKRSKSAKGEEHVELPREEELHPTISKRLSSLDIFAGCGGLSEGFHQAGVADSVWAVEKVESAAQAFRLNFPKCTVFNEDCNLILSLVMDQNQTHYKGQRLPQKGEVELLCGGPPCQGFSGMNRFNSRQYSLFKNSLIVSYLSYCDYYRPKFFLLENVRNFVSFKRNIVLKLTLRCLVRMGYQCAFGVLQAGNYGVPQTRRRAIILAAAPGEKLPFYPEPTHVFSQRSCQLSVVVDSKKYISNIKWEKYAPCRNITVQDSMSDLPEISNGAKTEVIAYSVEPISHFQRLMRNEDCGHSTLRDHICKEMSPLVEARMRNIPLYPGADWRDLPNTSIRLSDGNYTKKLIYSHHDKRNGRSSNGNLRGICSCANGKTCDPIDRQFNTLIPWCLPHTGNRHNNWAGLYGRLEWDGFFSTTVTNPEPMGKQGRVLHPEQHRVVSVRECARSQGFPDSYRFFGTILDRHRQIGNAVPPPLAAAIGMEIKKSLMAKEQSIATNGTAHDG